MADQVTPTPAPTPAPDRLASIKARRRPKLDCGYGPPFCEGCGGAWPCDHAYLLGNLREAEAGQREAEKLRAAIVEALRLLDSTRPPHPTYSWLARHEDILTPEKVLRAALQPGAPGKR